MSDLARLALIGPLALALTGCGSEESSPRGQGASVNDASAGADVSGEGVYQNNCLICHQADGSGVPGLYPHVADSSVVAGDPEPLIRMTLLGVGSGGDSIEPSGEWSGVMNSFQHLSDEQIAAVLTYIRQAWDNDASAVAPGQVAGVRREVLP